jgi:hypothetical protein
MSAESAVLLNSAFFWHSRGRLLEEVLDEERDVVRPLASGGMWMGITLSR